MFDKFFFEIFYAIKLTFYKVSVCKKIIVYESEKIRTILLDKENLELSNDAECLLFFASRNQLVKEKIIPELNKKYNKIVEDGEDISRNVNWKLVNFEFDNLFNYGESNSVNFGELGGIVGIFGKNFSGKSSIIDGALWTLFNSTSKNERKNINVINQSEWIKMLDKTS